MEFTLNTLAKMVLVLILAVVLILAFINPLTQVGKSFFSLGKTESTDLQYSKDQCTQLIDANKPIGDCAIFVANLSLQEGEAPVIAEAWLRKQIELTPASDKLTLQDCLNFARDDLYPVSLDWQGAADTYQELFAKLNTNEVEAQIYFTSIMKVYQPALDPTTTEDQRRNLLTASVNELKADISKAKAFYEKTKIDMSLLDSFSGCNSLFPLLAADSELSKHPESDVSSFRACSGLSQASFSTSCYPVYGISNSYCDSCKNYNKKTSDACSGYNNPVACELDSCGINLVCTWQGVVGAVGGSCISKQTFIGPAP